MSERQGAGLENRYGPKGLRGSNPRPSANAPVAQRIERWPAEPEVAGSNPAGRTTLADFGPSLGSRIRAGSHAVEWPQRASYDQGQTWH